VILAALVAGAPTTALAENAFARRGGQALDLVIVRPLGIGKIVFGFVAFIPVAAFAEVPVTGWNEDDGYNAVADVWDVFVVESFQATFMTPLGQIDDTY